MYRSWRRETYVIHIGVCINIKHTAKYVRTVIWKFYTYVHVSMSMLCYKYNIRVICIYTIRQRACFYVRMTSECFIAHHNSNRSSSFQLWVWLFFFASPHFSYFVLSFSRLKQRNENSTYRTPEQMKHIM